MCEQTSGSAPTFRRSVTNRPAHLAWEEIAVAANGAVPYPSLAVIVRRSEVAKRKMTILLRPLPSRRRKAWDLVVSRGRTADMSCWRRNVDRDICTGNSGKVACVGARLLSNRCVCPHPPKLTLDTAIVKLLPGGKKAAGPVVSDPMLFRPLRPVASRSGSPGDWLCGLRR